MSEGNMTPNAAELAHDLTSRGVAALQKMRGEDVLNGMMCALLNVALYSVSHKEVATWMRRLAEQIEADDPAQRLRVN